MNNNINNEMNNNVNVSVSESNVNPSVINGANMNSNGVNNSDANKSKNIKIIIIIIVVVLLGIVLTRSLLVMTVMPNVLDTFDTAKLNAFVTNASKLVSDAQVEFLRDKMASAHIKDIAYTNTTDVIDGVTMDNFDSSSYNNMKYCVVVDKHGIVVKLNVSNDEMHIKKSINSADGGITMQNILKDDVKKGPIKENEMCD